MTGLTTEPATGTTPPATSSRLVAAEVTLGYGERTVVRELSLRIPDHRVTVVVGPNACGKSTLLRAEGVTVVDLVGRGRHPHRGAFRRSRRAPTSCCWTSRRRTSTSRTRSRCSTCSPTSTSAAAPPW
jgi:ABC-type cobalamin/Fe3+-siderophores transport system ATPase subunit